MSTHCSAHDGIVSTEASTGIDGLVDRSLELIKKHIFPNAHRVNPSIQMELTLTKPRFWKYILSPDEKAFVLDPIDLANIAGIEDATNTKGCYISEYGKTFLNKTSWCIETVIHETLHSCSLTSLIPELRKYRMLYEGLTEFYTGYILYKEYHDAYENCWKTELGRYCQLTYEQSTKFWSSFCNFIPISITTGIYFHSNSVDWHKAYETFIASIRNLGYSKFNNPLSSKGPSAHLNFYKECASSFGSEFSKICSSREKFTDMSKIKSS